MSACASHRFALATMATLVGIALVLGGCGMPRVTEDMPDPTTWFEPEVVDIDGGWVTVHGSLLESVATSSGPEPGTPECMVYGMWPAPTGQGVGQEFSVDESRGFDISYDFGDPRRGIYMLVFYKHDSGRQYIYLDLENGRWSSADDF